MRVVSTLTELHLFSKRDWEAQGRRNQQAFVSRTLHAHPELGGNLGSESASPPKQFFGVQGSKSGVSTQASLTTVLKKTRA